MDKFSVFDTIPQDQWIFQSKFFFAIRDKFPVTPGHTLIISKASKLDYFALNDAERTELMSSILSAKEEIEKEFAPDGYNIGMNCGEAAGQTVHHFHCHVIPRYVGDMEDPRGGIRHCVGSQGYY